MAHKRQVRVQDETEETFGHGSWEAMHEGE
jgi:hypothetical protein